MSTRKLITYKNRVHNPESGEILLDTEKSVIITSATQDQFYMTYIEFMGPIYNIKSMNDMRVLAMLCMMMDYNTGKVYLTKERREEICEKAEIVGTVLSRSLASLKKLGLISGDNGTFEINPFIFWKGNSKERAKHLKNGGLTLKIKFKIEDNETGKIEPSTKFDENA